jgi:cephalosporin-C deacetylase-like acetyl esterase
MNSFERPGVFGLVASVLLSALGPAGAQTGEPRQKLIDYLDALARAQLAARQQAVASVETRADAERRRAMVRRKIVDLIGGLPESRGPVVARQFGAISGDGFRVEKMAFESQPGFWVTANVYVPTANAGPFPAIVLIPGHEAAGKTGQYAFGVNFARLGMVSLAFDPIGQGERLQYPDAGRNASVIGGPTGEHGEANLPTLLTGDNLVRYMVHDAMRAIDYLTSRKDVDGAHVGALGCSGGGAATAVLAALDDRVLAAATACYITSFQELLPSATGVQEAEQSIPRFIEQGLDFADWVEAAAPRAYAIVSTTEDMFPFEGARQTYQEAKRIYGLYGAGDRLQWITGPGGHGNLGPISPAILGFFAKYLKGDTAEQQMLPARPASPGDLLCTPAGQVAAWLGGETVYSLNRQRAAGLMAPQRAVANKAGLARLQARLRQDIRALAGIATQPAPQPTARAATASEQRDGYRIATVALPSTTGIDLAAVVAIPEPSGGKPAGRKPAVLVMDSQPMGGDLDRLAKLGRIVMALAPQPWPAGTESIKSPYLGAFNLLSLRAFLVGRTIVGIRAGDIILAMDWLCARPDVDPSAITVYGNGPAGMAVLDAAALDPRIGRVVVENTLVSYRSIVDVPLHRNMSEVVIPGVLRRYDVGDLLLAVSPRPVVVVNPRDGAGEAVSEPEFRKALAYVFQSERNLGTAQRITVRLRTAGEARPVD